MKLGKPQTALMLGIAFSQLAALGMRSTKIIHGTRQVRSKPKPKAFQGREADAYDIRPTTRPQTLTRWMRKRGTVPFDITDKMRRKHDWYSRPKAART